LYSNYNNIDVKQDSKIRNASDTTNDYIQFKDSELYSNCDINYFAGRTYITSGALSGSYYPLEVHGYKNAPDQTGSSLYYADVPSLGGRAIAINGSINMTARFEYGLWVSTGTELWVSSDERIKKDITLYDNTIGLDKLRNIDVKNFKYIDGKGRNPKQNEIGFIAQEVQKILPSAITKETEYLPNFYKKINCEWTEFEKKYKMKSSDLLNVSNIKYKFYVWNKDDKTETLQMIEGNIDNTFTFENKWDNVFCIGNNVNDFLALDKNSLFIINFSATKQLDKIVQEQKNEIDALKIELNNITEIMNKLINATSFKDFKKNIS
jgi:hypothetical protein